MPTRAVSAISLLVVHWDGIGYIRDGYDPVARYRWLAELHIARNWGTAERPVYGSTLMYHEKIDRSGTLYLCRDPQYVLWHATRANDIAYAINLDATVDSAPTRAQFAMLGWRLEQLCQQYGLGRDRVYGHGELTAYGNATQCPGQDALGWLRQWRAVGK